MFARAEKLFQRGYLVTCNSKIIAAGGQILHSRNRKSAGGRLIDV